MVYKEISFDNVYDKPKIELDKVYNTIEVKLNNYNLNAEPQELYNAQLDIIGTADVWIEYSASPAINIEISIQNGVINSQEIYSSACKLNITASGIVTVIITGQVFNIAQNIVTIQNKSTKVEEQTQAITIDNPLIGIRETAKTIADWILEDNKNKYLYGSNWRQNPAFEVADVVTIEDEFGENKRAIMTRQEYKYAGYLSGRTEAKGGNV